MGLVFRRMPFRFFRKESGVFPADNSLDFQCSRVGNDVTLGKIIVAEDIFSTLGNFSWPSFLSKSRIYPIWWEHSP